MKKEMASEVRRMAVEGSPKLRVSRNLAAYFPGKKIVFENHYTRQNFLSDPAVLQILAFFSTWRTPSQVVSLLPNFTRRSVQNMVRKLRDLDLLIEQGSEEEKFEKKFKEPWLWPLVARSYHFSTKIMEYSTREEDRRYFERNLRGKEGPSIYKIYPNAKTTPLLNWAGPQATFFATLNRRKTVRQFSGKSISFKQLSRIIRSTWGRSSYYETRAFGRLLHKTSPSAGGRHPIEAYCIVNSVQGLQPGLYHYNVKDDLLELLKTGDLRERCVEYCAGQEWVKNASVIFFMTAVVARTQWKYRDPRAYRALLLDTGHLSQTFLLTSSALGLDAFCIGVIADLLIEKALGLDGVTETALFAVGVGKPIEAAEEKPERSRKSSRARDPPM